MCNIHPNIAIVGSGPAGCYTAQFLKKALPDADITVFEALPAPYGLLRYGVAADHQGTKNIAVQFERMFLRDGVRFAGNVQIGKTVSYKDLQAAFDVVVAATGVPNDRRLGVPGDNLIQIIGAGKLLGALNSHPTALLPKQPDGTVKSLGKRVIVIGNGNVAIDVVRLLAKKDEELAGSDINDELRKSLATDQIERIDIIGRSGIESAKFDLSMLKEICHLDGVTFSWHGIQPSNEGPVLNLLNTVISEKKVKTSRIAINFIFDAEPLSVCLRSPDSILTLMNKHLGKIQDINCDSIITAVGFENESSEFLTYGPGFYPVGWARRGPKGAVAENRRDASVVAATIVNDLKGGLINTGKPGYSVLAQKLSGVVIDFNQWKNIDNFELMTAAPARCRNKVISIEKMLSIARTSSSGRDNGADCY
ncbi:MULTISPECIES: FAD-dependent oxidoreductase [Klebsiella/Raoultella group]|uniref:FAD-dependent oxidoreductase n=1 Tax=Klebsiella/Raoultella group TaxID=2890311 RepID=UPI0015A736D3|nr:MULTISPECIES: FAD-dependent oxidoreductase [Klebsiella/Raoultella group]QLK20863.1 NAD(P)-binding protein [Raoultella ornithinolytica]